MQLMKANIYTIATIQTGEKGVLSAIGTNMYLFSSASINCACSS